MDLPHSKFSVATCSYWSHVLHGEVSIFTLNYTPNLLTDSGVSCGIVEGSGHLELTPLSGTFTVPD